MCRVDSYYVFALPYGVRLIGLLSCVLHFLIATCILLVYFIPSGYKNFHDKVQESRPARIVFVCEASLLLMFGLLGLLLIRGALKESKGVLMTWMMAAVVNLITLDCFLVFVAWQGVHYIAILLAVITGENGYHILVVYNYYRLITDKDPTSNIVVYVQK